jgi:hypothetical protein
MDSSKAHAGAKRGQRNAPPPEPREPGDPLSLGGVLADEARWLPRRLGGWSGMLLYGGFLAILGYLFPRAMGLSFLDPHILLVYACSAPFFVTSVAVEAFTDTRDLAPPRTLFAGRMIACSLFGWLSSAAALGLALGSLNTRESQAAVVLPDTRFLLGILAFGLSLSLFTVASAALLCLYVQRAKQAKMLLRRVFFIALVAMVLLGRYGEVEWKDSFTALLTPDSIFQVAAAGSAAFVVLTAAVIAVALRHPRYSGASQPS